MLGVRRSMSHANLRSTAGGGGDDSPRLRRGGQGSFQPGKLLWVVWPGRVEHDQQYRAVVPGVPASGHAEHGDLAGTVAVHDVVVAKDGKRVGSVLEGLTEGTEHGRRDAAGHRMGRRCRRAAQVRHSGRYGVDGVGRNLFLAVAGADVADDCQSNLRGYARGWSVERFTRGGCANVHRHPRGDVVAAADRSGTESGDSEEDGDGIPPRISRRLRRRSRRSARCHGAWRSRSGTRSSFL